jgi:hypothetical protein
MVMIGVTGHRVLSEPEKIGAGVNAALRRIRSTFPNSPLTVISSLAEGADRLVARRVLSEHEGRLIVALPLPRADYINDFSSAESRLEFLDLLDGAEDVIELPPSPTRVGSYAAAGNYVLDHCDVLVAVWDGQPAQGEAGTAAVVASARARGLPLAWIHAGNRKPDTLEPTSLGNAQGTVSYERLPT